MKTNNAKFLRNLVISYSILLIVVLIMGVYLYTISIKNVSKEIRNQNLFMLDKTIHDMDSAFKNMDVLSGQIVNNSTIAQLSNIREIKDNAFYLKAYHAQNDLAIYVSTESILPIHSYYLYLLETDYILSSSQFQDSGLYYRGTRKYYIEMFEQWQSMMKNEDLYRKFVPLDPYKSYSDNSFLYMMRLDNYTFKKVPSIICFEIDYQKLRELFSELNFFQTGYLYVTDENNQPVFSIYGKDADADSLVDFNSLEFTNHFSTYESREQLNMFVTQSLSSYNSWNYYFVQPEDESLYSLKQYRDFFIAIILGGLLFEVMVVLFLSRSNVKKITQLGEELQDTLTKQEKLQQLVENQRPLIMDSYLMRIMTGTISTQEELDYAGQYLGINSVGLKFCVLHIVTYVNQFEMHVENSAVTGPDDLNYRSVIEESIQNFFDVAATLVDATEREFTLLLSSPTNSSDAEATLKVHSDFEAFHEYLLNTHSIWTFAGLGDWNEGLMITWKSYQQATQAITYATKRKSLCEYQNIERDSKGFYYPIELTRQLTNFITSGNRSQVQEIFEIIRHENLEVRSIPLHMVKYLLSDIRNTLYKIRFTIEESEKNEAELLSIDNAFDEHMSLKLCEDLALCLCQLFEKRSSGNQLIATIRKYIDENYQDPSLGLNKIADEFPISESYFSFLFKEEVGENFSSYLERKRMEHALDLLKETSMNINDVYKEVGYNNSHSFRRVFKKIYGMLPTEVRSSDKKGD
ncbi:MAG: AraC family transcriptional regulator [Vallitaleaceae bacterium]|nr:AraC family transcriptional regulator [Vallitaleaceae bacterium]